MPTTLHENRPSAGIGVVEVQKPKVFCDFQPARATLCGDRRGRGAKTHVFFCDFCAARATICGDRRGRGAKTHGFLRFLSFARPSARIGVVEVQKPMVSCDFCAARATICGDRRGRGAKTHGFLRFLRRSRDPLRGSAWSRCKNPRFFAISNLLARPSAGIGVVEVQKPMFFFCDFCAARATLCGDRRGRGAKTFGFFCDFCGARATLCGDRRGRGAKTHGFLRFQSCSRDPLRGSAWSRCKNPWFFAISAVLAQPLVFGSCLVVRAPLPEPAGRGFDSSLVRGRASQDATCILKQLAQSKLHRATCADQLAPTSLRRAPCLEQLAQSNLRKATCAEQLAQSKLHGAQFAQSNLQGATCRDQLAGATCAEQLAQSNLHSATCVEQLAQTNLHRPVCAEHLAWCCLALASQMLRGGKKNASCSVGPTSLAMLCFRANRGLVVFCFFNI